MTWLTERKHDWPEHRTVLMTVDGFSVEDVSLTFGGITALDSLSFEVPKGMVCGLIGPNGAGKTTLFNCASGIYAPSTGRITFDGTNLLASAEPKENRT